MKKIALLAVLCVATFTFSSKAALTAEQKETRKELLEKYDTNKDGKLDADEKSKMTDEDKAKWKTIAAAHKKKKADDSSSTTPAPDAPATNPPATPAK